MRVTRRCLKRQPAHAMKGMRRNPIAGTERSSDGGPNIDASVTASSPQNTASSARRAGMSLSLAGRLQASTQEVTTMIPVVSPCHQVYQLAKNSSLEVAPERWIAEAPTLAETTLLTAAMAADMNTPFRS